MLEYNNTIGTHTYQFQNHEARFLILFIHGVKNRAERNVSVKSNNIQTE